MAGSLDLNTLKLAFETRPDLVAGIQQAADSPAKIALFNDISTYVHQNLRLGSEPALKRRRVDGGGSDESAAGGGNGNANGSLPSRTATGSSPAGLAAAAAAEPVLLEVKDISLSMPQRKKFDLCFTRTFLYARAPNTAGPVQGIVYPWKSMEHIFYVPVPDKAQLQYSYIVFPRGTTLSSLSKSAAAAAATTDMEPLIFTVPATAPKPGTVGGTSAAMASAISDTYSSLLHWALEAQLLSSGTGVRVVGTDAKVFHSVARQAFRPSEKAVHVRAFRGSKDGYLFFLPVGILWAFKKPLLFIPLGRISAVSYTSVLQRTFNIVVEVDVDGNQPEEVEFAMLDQEDYTGIDENYVRRHGLQDRSMAEQRKAKLELAENARENKMQAAGDDDDDDDGEAQDKHDGANSRSASTHGRAPPPEDDGLTALQRAERQLQDAEDEMEEDYDPGSDGESDGSGSSGSSSNSGDDAGGEDGEDDSVDGAESDGSQDGQDEEEQE